MDLLLGFAAIGIIIFLGFLASAFFDRTKIPDILILIGLGILVGPVLRLIDPAPFDAFLPFFAALALVLIMFSAGLRFNFYSVLSQLTKTTAFTLVAYFVAAALITVFTHFVLGWPLLFAAFLGVILSDTCPTIVNALVPKLRGTEATKISISLEATISGALSTVLAISLLQFMSLNSIDLSVTASSVASAFSIAIVLGLIAGIFWLYGLKRLRGQPYSYLLTIAAVFLLYVVVETVRGNGAIAALLFGIVLGNSKEVTSALRLKGYSEPGKNIYLFQEEVTFFVRTLFFVYVGLVFHPGLSAAALGIAFVCLLCILASRTMSAKIFTGGWGNPDTLLQTFVIPTGLAAIVLSFLPASKGIVIPGITEIVLLIVLMTNLVTAVAIYWSHSMSSPASKPKIVSVKRGE